jgi:hypothetical protein
VREDVRLVAEHPAAAGSGRVLAEDPRPGPVLELAGEELGG